MAPTTPDLDHLAVNAVRALAMDAVEQAGSGHPGAPMGMAPVALRLWTGQLHHDPADPTWPDRDRFVLSAGHASMLLYALLHLTGYGLSLDEIKRFRQLGSVTPGHPESELTEGVETTTGPLGQGLGNAVGMALGERLLAARFNRPGHEIVDHRTWVIASDGDLMEGLSSEASSLAGHLQLAKLVVLYDDNSVTIDGPTALSFAREDVGARYAAYGWRVLTIKDANDLDHVDEVLEEAARSDGRPTLVRVPTVIGYGAPTKAGTAAVHGAALGADELRAAKEALGWPYEEAFFVPDHVREHIDQTTRGAGLHARWSERLSAYEDAHPELARDFRRLHEGVLPEGWDELLPGFEPGEQQATRKSSAAVINAIAGAVPELVGGSADLAASNNTTITDAGDVEPPDYTGRNINYGVREHAMAAAMNGLALHGLRPFGGTFLTFSDYLRPSLRLAALMGLPVIYVFTHDSVGLGEDGPTHQPVEHLAALRAIPNVHVIRPADATETAGAWRAALTRREGPTALSLTRQKVTIQPTTRTDGVDAGAYTLVEPDGEPDVVIVATGSEVELAVAAVDLLDARGLQARVVSMPCWERFEQRPRAEQQALLPPAVPVLSVEAAVTFGWSRWADGHVGIDRFGESAPYQDVYAALGLTPEGVADAAARLCRT